MKQEYFVVVLAHSLRGRLRRIHVPHQAVYIILALALLGCFSVFGFVASYARMAWKVANYNALKHEADALRARYQSLQQTVSERNQQLASLQLYAKEVSLAFDIKERLEGSSQLVASDKLLPSFAESVQDYDFLRSGRQLMLSSRATNRPRAAKPNIWPVDGRLIFSPFGTRTDPFSGEGAFHKGVDISAGYGTRVRATASGLVLHAGNESGYGKLVVIDHGNGVETYYAHLSRMYVRPGQVIMRGEYVGEVGSSGRATAAHLHYEVRSNGVPQNPYHFLAKADIFQQAAAPQPLF